MSKPPLSVDTLVPGPRPGGADEGADAALSDQWRLLAAEAVRLSDAKFLQIYTLLEQLGGKPGVTQAFDALRPRLTTLRPPRRLNASRLFFQPAEDLFDDPAVYGRGLHRVSRATLSVCWRQIQERLDPALLGPLEQAVAACDPHDEARIYQAGLPLWRAGAEQLAVLAEEADRNLRFRAATFGRDEDVLAQVHTLVAVIRLGAEIEDLKQRLPPRPIGDLSESQMAAIKTVLARLGDDDPARAGPVLLVLAARMRRPGDVLRLLDGLRLSGNQAAKDDLIRDMSGIFISQLLHQTAQAGGEGGTDAGRKDDAAVVRDLARLAACAERLSDGLTSLGHAVNALRDAKVAAAAGAARTSIGKLVLRRVLVDIDIRLKNLMFGGGVAVTPPDRMKQAEEAALVLRRSARLAGALGVQREVGDKVTTLCREMERRIGDLLSGGRAADPAARRQTFNILRIVEMLSGPDEAERLYRQAQRKGL